MNSQFLHGMKLIYILCAFAFLITLILTPFFSVGLSSRIYFAVQEKVGVYHTFDKSFAQKRTIAVINYLKNKQPFETKYYRTKEIVHMSDVKDLVLFALKLL